MISLDRAAGIGILPIPFFSSELIYDSSLLPLIHSDARGLWFDSNEQINRDICIPSSVQIAIY